MSNITSKATFGYLNKMKCKSIIDESTIMYIHPHLPLAVTEFGIIFVDVDSKGIYKESTTDKPFIKFNKTMKIIKSALVCECYYDRMFSKRTDFRFKDGDETNLAKSNMIVMGAKANLRIYFGNDFLEVLKLLAFNVSVSTIVEHFKGKYGKRNIELMLRVFNENNKNPF
jgi:hypothetical protein